MSTKANRIRKCQSRKHKIGGCGDPKCPEGLSIKAALTAAVPSGDLDAFFTMKEQERLRGGSLFGSWGWGKLYVTEPKSGRQAMIKVKLNRPEFVEAIRSIDKTNTPSFENLKSLNEWVDSTYGTGVYYDLREYKSNPNNKKLGIPDMGMDVISVAQITVDADIQGIGISNHLKRVLVRYADEHNVILSGTPTNMGDGSIEEGEDGWVENALAHRARLERSYQKNGYIRNPCVVHRPAVDYLTKKKEKYDFEGASHFPEKAQRFLYDRGDWIRFPKGKIPKRFIETNPKPIPEWANDDDE
jgi:hypothetical protein